MAEDPQTARIVRKVVRHLMPVLGVMYLIAYIDRQNIGSAKMTAVPATIIFVITFVSAYGLS